MPSQNLQLNGSTFKINNISFSNLSGQKYHNISFGESYYCTMPETEIDNISASYDLTIIGDIIVSGTIEVRKNLTVLGNISCTELICTQNLICTGKIQADSVDVGGNLTCDALNTNELVCDDGNIICQTCITVGNSAETGLVIAGEGVLGTGDWETNATIVMEYNQLTGGVKGTLINVGDEDYLATVDPDRINRQQTTIHQELSLIDQISSLDDSLMNVSEYGWFVDAPDILDALSDLKSITTIDYMKVYDWCTKINNAVRIFTIDELIFASYAQKIFPTKLNNSDDMKDLFERKLPAARSVMSSLRLKADGIDEIARLFYFVCQANLSSREKDYLYKCLRKRLSELT